MAAPRGAFSRPFLHTPSPRDHGDGNVLAVGWRVLVVSPEGKGHRVALMDSEGTTTVTTLPHGAEVEILAWRPRRSGATMYRVQPTSGGKEGWVSGASLKARPAPAPRPAPKPAAQPAPVPARVPARVKVRPIVAAGPQPAAKRAPNPVSKPASKPAAKAASKTISKAAASKGSARTSRSKTSR
jgi:hypothetical protein